MAAVRDFDPTQINSDFSAILEQAGISFTYQGNSVTGVWSSSRDAFSEFEDQRRADSKFTVFLLTSSVSATPQVTQTLSRAGITYFIERVTLDAYVFPGNARNRELTWESSDVRVAHIGRSSVRYEVGIFVAGAQTCAARGHFVHVYVDRDSRRPVAALPAAPQRTLEALT